MRNLHLLNEYRRTDLEVLVRFVTVGDETCEVFELPSPVDGKMLRVIASSGGGWDHVSVSRRNRCPNWPEMSHVKNLFFRPDETVMQLHVPASDHVNDHEFCLHLWRPQDAEIPRPPKWMVGGMSRAEAEAAAEAAGV